MRLIDLTGKRFGRLVVQGLARRENGRRFWLCHCDCGENTTIDGGSLRRGHTKSCGCFRREEAKRTRSKHGWFGTHVYEVWRNMKHRCTSPSHKSYKDYGGRGLTVCKRWLSFEPFLADMGEPPPGMTLGRKDNNLGYSPDNCRWETPMQQQNNRRSNRLVTYQGETKTLRQWARQLPMHHDTLKDRLNRGWSVEDAFTLPIRKSARFEGEPSVSIRRV